jgi:hypothetical protein
VKLLYFVRTVRTDGSTVLSRPFEQRAKACQWARIARRDTQTIVQALVITRQVQPLGSGPTRPTAA